MSFNYSMQSHRIQLGGGQNLGYLQLPVAGCQNRCELKGGSPTMIVDKGDVAIQLMVVAGLVVQPKAHDGPMIQGTGLEWTL